MNIKGEGHKQLEEIIEARNVRLKEQDTFIETLFDSTIDLIIVVDRDRRILKLNKKANAYFTRLFPVELIGRPIDEISPKLRQTGILDKLGEAFNKGETISHIEFKSTVEDTYFDVDFIPVGDGTGVEAVMILMRNVTENVNARREIEKANILLKQRNEFIEAIIDSSREWIAVWDKDLTLRMLNKACTVAMGGTEEDFIGKKLYDLYKDVRGTKSESDLLEALKGNHIKNEPFFSALTGKYIQNYLTPLLDENGNVQAALAIATDVTEIKKTEEEAKKSQQRFSMLFNVSPLPLALSIVGDGKIIDVNPAWEKLFELNREEIIGRTAAQIGIVKPEEREQSAKEITESRGRRSAVEMKYHLKPDKQIHALLSVETVELDGQQCFLSAIQDISEQKRIEKESQRSQQHFSMLFNVSPVAMSLSHVRGGTISNVNEAWEELFGIRRNDIIGKTVVEAGLSRPEDRAERINELKRQGGTLRASEFKFSRNDKKTIDVLLSVETVEINSEEYYLAAYLDITERKRSEEQVKKVNSLLANKNTQLEEAQRLAHIGSWEWDIMENRISWSDELYRIYGVEKESFELTFENFIQRVHPEDRERVGSLVKNAMENRIPFEYKHRILRPDGGIRTLHATGEVVLNEKKEAVKMTGTGQDITDIVNVTLELERKNKDLEAMNKELTSFSYIASHDLQEPLRKIQMFAKRIHDKEHELLSEEGKKYFNRMDKAAARMQQLIQDLLKYSRTATSHANFETTDLNQLLENVKDGLHEKIAQTQAVIHAGKLPELKVIPFQFQQLLTNLLTNSIKFAKPGVPPEIHITHELHYDYNSDNVPPLRGKPYHQVTISDNGIGFNQKYSTRVFELFQRLHGRDEFDGTGIGLAICKKIVENHEGVILAEAEEGKGATFKVYLPEKN